MELGTILPRRSEIVPICCLHGIHGQVQDEIDAYSIVLL